MTKCVAYMHLWAASLLKLGITGLILSGCASMSAHNNHVDRWHMGIVVGCACDVAWDATWDATWDAAWDAMRHLSIFFCYLIF